MLVFDWKRRAGLFALGVAVAVLGVFLVGWFVGRALPRLRGLRKGCYHWVAT